MNQIADLRPWFADAMVVTGVLVMTAGIIGMVRMPDVYTKIHAAGKSVFLGAVLLVLSSVVTGDAQIIDRAVLIAVLLLITTPVSAHILGQAAWQSERRQDNV